jgi:hypothetical protein
MAPTGSRSYEGRPFIDACFLIDECGDDARFAVNSAHTLIVFVLETWEARKG